MNAKIMEDGIDFESSNIKKIEFNYDNLHLKVTYKFGKTTPYEFCIKNILIYEELENAKSKGTYISRKLKNNKNFNIYTSGCNHL
ncbi:KTSC domain-containing protein [Mesoplasma seiffertii]|uniref:KTSC domain-containing protein n=1 Tax=Mesoplasma seiffertii TaxID=28224 RepID=UPI000479CB44|nr:KTSC domain-containing protein [Mesoplasma seiffertii]